MNDDTASLFLNFSIRKLDLMEGYLNACLDRLTDEQVWHRGGAQNNTVANLVIHLCGNTRQWILFGVGGQPDVRDRPLEFSAAGGVTVAELKALFAATVAEARGVIAALPHERLTERIVPQGTEVAVLEAIYQVVGHVQQHVGQIILLTKQLTASDLDLTQPRPR